MTSPDFRDYVDLTINDLQPSDIYDAAVSYAKTALPDFAPREGTVEDAVLQSMSYIAGLLTGAINRLPNGLMEGVLELFGFTREQSSFATGAVIFTAIDTSGLTIPAGTRVAYIETVDGTTIQHVFATDEAVIIAPGSSTSSAVSVTAVSSGVKPVIDSGDTMVLLTASNRILSAEFSGTLTQGGAGETDEAYFARGATYLGSLSAGLATKQQVTDFILSTYSEVRRCTTLDRTNVLTGEGVQIYETSGLLGASLSIDPTGLFPTPQAGEAARIVGASDSKFNSVFEIDSLNTTTVFLTDTSGASSGETLTGAYTIQFLKNLEEFDTSGGISLYGSDPAPGYATTVVSDASGNPLTDTLKSSIQSAVGDRLVAGIDYDLIDAFVVDVACSVDISLLPGYDEIAVRDAVQAVVDSYISPANWNWGTRIRVNNILALASNVAGVDYVDAVSFSLSTPELLAQIDGSTGDVEILYRGTLPSSTTTVSVV